MSINIVEYNIKLNFVKKKLLIFRDVLGPEAKGVPVRLGDEV